jgi:ABC-type transport system substrate-binding protein
MVYGPVRLALDPDAPLYSRFIPEQSQNRGYVNDPKLTAMLKEQRRTRELEARKKLIDEIQRYIAEQQYYVYANSVTITGTWQPYVKNYAPNHTFDYGSRVAALWLDR